MQGYQNFLFLISDLDHILKLIIKQIKNNFKLGQIKDYLQN